jgi:GTP-binding protein
MNKPESLHFSYKRYLENEIRKEYGFFGTALDLEFKRKSTTDRKNADKPIKEPRPKKTKSTYKKIVRRGK